MSAGPQPGPTAGWSEPFAPKLEGLKISELKKSFLSNFPSEVLTPATTPSTRLLSLAAHQHSKGDFKWIPWKFRMSQERADELQIQRPAKVAKLDALSLHDLLVDEPPAIEVNNSNMGLGAVRNLLAVHDTALAMVGSAHLARLKALSLRFLHFMSQRFEAESHLRAPTVLEAQQADAKLWQLISSLVHDKAFSLNDALFEVTEVRGDLSSLLQPRPRVPSIPAMIHVASAHCLNEGGQGLGQVVQQSAFQAEVGHILGEGWEEAPALHAIPDCQVHSWRLLHCRFYHGCAYPKSDGAACGGDHGALAHKETTH